MCGGLRIHRVNVRPGVSIKYTTLSGERAGTWGLGGGFGAYNARVENLDKTWKTMKDNRAVLEVDSFEEKGAYFKVRGEEKVYLAAIYDISGDIVLITQPAAGGVEKLHHRMPTCLRNTELWLQDGTLYSDISLELAEGQPVTNDHSAFVQSLTFKLNKRWPPKTTVLLLRR